MDPNEFCRELEKLDERVFDAFSTLAKDDDFDGALKMLHDALDELPLPWISFCLTSYLMHWFKDLLEEHKNAVS